MALTRQHRRHRGDRMPVGTRPRPCRQVGQWWLVGLRRSYAAAGCSYNRASVATGGQAMRPAPAICIVCRPFEKTIFDHRQPISADFCAEKSYGVPTRGPHSFSGLPPPRPETPIQLTNQSGALRFSSPPQHVARRWPSSRNVLHAMCCMRCAIAFAGGRTYLPARRRLLRRLDRPFTARPCSVPRWLRWLITLRRSPKWSSPPACHASPSFWPSGWCSMAGRIACPWICAYSFLSGSSVPSATRSLNAPIATCLPKSSIRLIRSAN